MSFDIFDIGTTRSDDGVPYPIPNLRTGLPIMIPPEKEGEAEKPLTITLLGRNSAVFMETMEMIRKDRDALQAAGKLITRDIIYEEDTRLLTACTVNWAFDKRKGQPFPCVPRNIRQFWMDRIFDYVRAGALAFILADVNFLPESSTLSSATPNTSSASPSPSPTMEASSPTPSRPIDAPPAAPTPSS